MQFDDLRRYAEAGALNDLSIEPMDIELFCNSAGWLLLRQRIVRTLDIAYRKLKSASDIQEIYAAQGMIKGLEWVIGFGEQMIDAHDENASEPDEIRNILDM